MRLLIKKPARNTLSEFERDALADRHNEGLKICASSGCDLIPVRHVGIKEFTPTSWRHSLQNGMLGQLGCNSRDMGVGYTHTSIGHDTGLALHRSRWRCRHRRMCSHRCRRRTDRASQQSLQPMIFSFNCFQTLHHCVTLSCRTGCSHRYVPPNRGSLRSRGRRNEKWRVHFRHTLHHRVH